MPRWGPRSTCFSRRYQIRSHKELLRVYKLICTVCLISTVAQFKWFPKDLKALWVLNEVLEFPAFSFACELVLQTVFLFCF